MCPRTEGSALDVAVPDHVVGEGEGAGDKAPLPGAEGVQANSCAEGLGMPIEAGDAGQDDARGGGHRAAKDDADKGKPSETGGVVEVEPEAAYSGGRGRVVF